MGLGEMGHFVVPSNAQQKKICVADMCQNFHLCPWGTRNISQNMQTHAKLQNPHNSWRKLKFENQ